MRLQASAVIERPPSAVWQFFAVNHVVNHPRWDPAIELEQVSDGPLRLGTLIRRRNTRSGTAVDGTMEVVEFEPERSLKMLIQEGPAQMHGFADFEAEGSERTRLTIGADIPWLEESAASESLSGEIQRSADRIKSMVEAETPPA